MAVATSRYDRVIKSLDCAQSRLHRIAFGALIGLAVVLRLAVFEGYSDSDPRDYTVLANDLAHGELHIPEGDHSPAFPPRVGLYAPTAALIRFFGLSETTIAAYPFVVSIAGCLLAYLLARGLSTPLAGLIGLGAYAVLPIDVSMASLLYPDAIAAFWANAGMALALVALSRSKLQESALLGALSGSFFGASWLCKESVIYLIPFVALLVFVLRRHARWAVRATCMAAIVMAAGAVVAAEMFYYAGSTGDPLFRLHAVERAYAESAAFFFDPSSPLFGWPDGGYARALVKRVLFSGPGDLLLNGRMSFVPAIAMLGVARAAVFRQRSVAIPTVWLVSLLLMFNFMTSSFSSYKPLPLFDRYVYSILLPSVLIISAVVAALLAAHPSDDRRVRTERRFWGVALVVMYVGVSAVGIRRETGRPQQLERAVAVQLDESDLVYSDYRTAANLVFFRTGSLVSSNATTRPWEQLVAEDIPRHAYVLFNKEKTDSLRLWYGYEGPSFADTPPSHWKMVWSNDSGSLYRVDNE